MYRKCYEALLQMDAQSKFNQLVTSLQNANCHLVHNLFIAKCTIHTN